MNTTEKTRRITVLCHAERHNYCLDGCDCSCHFDLEVKQTLTELGYELWRASIAFKFPEEDPETRRGRLRGVIRSAENSVDFLGYGVDEVTDRMERVIARDYWSIWEFNDDFDLELGGNRKIS